jgi:hypothetical protein
MEYEHIDFKHRADGLARLNSESISQMVIPSAALVQHMANRLTQLHHIVSE